MALIKSRKEKFPSQADFYALTSNKRYGPCYLFIGQEDFLIDECIKSIIDDLLPQDVQPFNLDILDGSKIDALSVVACASAYPMMNAWRVVVVKDFDQLVSTDKTREVVDAYIQRPLESTCLVMVAEKPDFRTNPFHALKKSNTVFNFPMLYDNQVPAWIAARCTSAGKTIDIEASRLLHEYVGNSLRILQNELQKLFTFIGERNQISIVDITQVVGETKGNSIFDLQNAIGRQDLLSSMKIIKRMVETGESPQGIVVMLTRYFTTIWKVKELHEHGNSEMNVAQEVKLSPFFVKDYIIASENYSVQQIESAFSLLLNADLQIKTSSPNPYHVLEMLIYSIINSTAKRTAVAV